MQLDSAGLDAIGVDYGHNKDKPRGKCIMIDMSKDSGIPILLRVLQQRNVKYVSMAPPCGTASRARERRLKTKDGRRAQIDPQPLRSEEFPDGLPSLGQLDAQRVKAANTLYRKVAELVSGDTKTKPKVERTTYR